MYGICVAGNVVCGRVVVEVQSEGVVVGRWVGGRLWGIRESFKIASWVKSWYLRECGDFEAREVEEKMGSRRGGGVKIN